MGVVRWSGVIGTIMLLGLGACASPEQQQQPRRTANAGVCPPVRNYSEDFRKRAVAEMDLLPGNSAVEEMLTDYAVLRQQILGCRN
jgi:hypothetical protein